MTEAAFLQAFDQRFDQMSKLLETPSAAGSAPSAVSSATLEDILKKVAAQKGAPKAAPATTSCQPCTQLMQPVSGLTSKMGSMGNMSTQMSWAVALLLIVAILVIVFGILGVFKNSSEAKRSRSLMGAPHMAAGLGMEQELSASGQDGEDHKDETNPENILPAAHEGVVFVFFHATWCGHCKQFKPIFETVAKQSKGKARFKSVVSDVLQQSSHAQKMPAIQGFPTIFVFVNGQHVDSMVGNQGEEALRALIAKHAA